MLAFLALFARLDVHRTSINLPTARLAAIFVLPILLLATIVVGLLHPLVLSLRLLRALGRLREQRALHGPRDARVRVRRRLVEKNVKGQKGVQSLVQARKGRPERIQTRDASQIGVQSRRLHAVRRERRALRGQRGRSARATGEGTRE